MAFGEFGEFTVNITYLYYILALIVFRQKQENSQTHRQMLCAIAMEQIMRYLCAVVDCLSVSRATLHVILLTQAYLRKYYRIGVLRYNWFMSAHASQAFSTPTVLED